MEIYREHQLYRFVFEVDGRRYVWHQPKTLVTFPVQLTLRRETEYQAAEVSRYDALMEKDQRELYMMTVWEYLRAHGVTEKDVWFRFPSLRRSVRADWLNSKMRRKWRKRTTGVRKMRDNVKRLWVVARTGEMPALEDEIPF